MLMSSMSYARSPATYYQVFKVQDGPVMSDPDVTGPRYHTKLFIEIGTDGSGFVHHVTGDLVSGMHYESKPSPRPEEAETFHRKELLGMVAASAYPGSINAVCAALPAPQRQKAFNITTMRTEPIKLDGSFFRAGESRPKLFKCTEWTENHAIPALKLARVIETKAT